MFSLLLAVVLLVSLPSCASLKEEVNKIKNRNSLRIGLLLINGENETDVDELKSSVRDMGIKERRIKISNDVSPENAYNELCSLAENGCNLIFILGKSPEDSVVQAATDYPEAEFFHFNSINSGTSGTANLHTALFDETQLRYTSGIAAGYKLRELIESGQITENNAQVGFVASYPDSKAISAYTAFYLGVKSVCESALMQVQYTYDSENETSVQRAFKALISNGCVLISQQSETETASEICQRNNVYYIGQNRENDSRHSMCIASINRNSAAVCAAVIEKVINEGSTGFVLADYSNSDSNSTLINSDAFADKDLLNEAKNKISETENSFAGGTLKVFDTSKWTVNGERIKSTVEEEFYENKEYIVSNSYFSEYEFSAEPKFAFIIDGITQMNADDKEEDLL